MPLHSATMFLTLRYKKTEIRPHKYYANATRQLTLIISIPTYSYHSVWSFSTRTKWVFWVKRWNVFLGRFFYLTFPGSFHSMRWNKNPFIHQWIVTTVLMLWIKKEKQQLHLFLCDLKSVPSNKLQASQKQKNYIKAYLVCTKIYDTDYVFH